MIIELPNILDKDTCEECIRYYESNPDLLQTLDASGDFNGTSIEGIEIRGRLRKKLEALKDRILVAAAKHFHENELYPCYWNINKWTQGRHMDWHADNQTQEREPLSYQAEHYDISAVVYLNHDFTGGETLFKNQNQQVMPTQGTAIIFPATFSYTHGVQCVHSGTRYTVALWMTRNPEYYYIKA